MWKGFKKGFQKFFIDFGVFMLILQLWQTLVLDGVKHESFWANVLYWFFAISGLLFAWISGRLVAKKLTEEYIYEEVDTDGGN